MSQVRELSEADLDDFIAILANTYPTFQLNTEEDRQRMKQRLLARMAEPTNHLYGLYREGKLLGGMLLFDFTMNCLSIRAKAGGVGLVAVDILHKKAHVAKDLITFFVKYYKDRGATLALLYPFRPDFYKKMGFGYGTKMHQYRVRPDDLPGGGAKQNVAYLQQDDKQLLLDCYNAYLAETHGMIEKSAFELNSLFTNSENRIVGYKKDGSVSGYVVFTFKSAKHDNFGLNDLHVKEFIYTDREALAGLLAFLRSQSDQINRIFFNTQDEYFHYLLRNPRNGSDNLIPHVYHESNTQGVGLMYRVIDTPGIFRLLAGHSFGDQSCRLKLTVDDDFFPENDTSTIIDFANGRPQITADSDGAVEMRLCVADFSSLIIGAVRFKNLYAYGLVDVSDPSAVATIDHLFRTEQKPICTTPF
jgi:predicted acetyltransferase